MTATVQPAVVAPTPNPAPEMPVAPLAPKPAPAAVPPVAANPAGRVKLELSGAQTSEVLAVLYREVWDGPFVLPPEAYADERRMSIRIDAPLAQAREQADRYMRAIGYRARSVDGVDLVERIGEPKRAFTYRPRYREAAYLAQAIAPVMGEAGSLAGQGGPQGGLGGGDRRGGGTTGLGMDDLVLFATEEQIARVRAVLAAVDRPAGDLEVLATVYEVTLGQDDGSALQLAAAVASSRLGAAIAWEGAGPQGGSLKVKLGGVEALLGAFSTDDRFRVVTSNGIRARSGAEARFTAGDQVPTLGNVSYQGASGTAVQGVEYRDSGIVVSVKPTLRGSSVEVGLHQEISTFTQTTTGVNSSPTLQRRALDSELTLRDGQTIVVGGLRQTKVGQASRGIFGIPLESQGQDRTTEILVVLRVKAVHGGRDGDHVDGNRAGAVRRSVPRPEGRREGVRPLVRKG